MCEQLNTPGQALIQAFPWGFGSPLSARLCPARGAVPTLPARGTGICPRCPGTPRVPRRSPEHRWGLHGARLGAWGKHWSLESSTVVPAKQQAHFPGRLGSLLGEPGRGCRGLAVSQCTREVSNEILGQERKGLPTRSLGWQWRTAAQGLGPLCRPSFPSPKLLFTCIGYFFPEFVLTSEPHSTHGRRLGV